MAISPPNWAKNAVPTTRGWELKGELLVARKHTQSQIDEYNGATTEAARPSMLRESPVNEFEFVEQNMQEPEELLLESMTKLEIEAVGRRNGIELDRRNSKDFMIAQLRDHMQD